MFLQLLEVRSQFYGNKTVMVISPKSDQYAEYGDSIFFKCFQVTRFVGLVCCSDMNNIFKCLCVNLIAPTQGQNPSRCLNMLEKLAILMLNRCSMRLKEL